MEANNGIAEKLKFLNECKLRGGNFLHSYKKTIVDLGLPTVIYDVANFKLGQTEVEKRANMTYN